MTVESESVQLYTFHKQKNRKIYWEITYNLGETFIL